MNATIAQADTKAKKVSKLRIAAAGVLGAAGLSVVASLVPAVASADPYQPNTGHRHPIAHYFGNIEYPGWAITHPINAALP
jgi:multisubunit Na+/H+ antiporter MnhB subunit